MGRNERRAGVRMFRIGECRYSTEERLKRLVEFLEAHRSAVDEVALFIGQLHDYMALEIFRRKLPAARRALEELGSRGFTVGLNILCTIGHRDEYPGWASAMDVPTMVGHDGTKTRTVACPASPEFLAATAERYRLAAELHPAFIWVDDDVRMYNHRPVVFGCFCEHCLREFNEEHGTQFDRRRLVAELSRDTWPEVNETRLNWMRRNAAVTARIHGRIERSVHAVDGEVTLGQMGGEVFECRYNGNLSREALDALRGAPERPLMLRPGGGAYLDRVPMDFIHKAYMIANQVAEARPRPDCIESEIESFPYHRPMKGVRTTMFEASCYIAAGCDGTAFNILGGVPDPMDEYHSLMDGVEGRSAFWRGLAEACGDMPLVGLWPGYSGLGLARRPVGREGWPGISICYSAVAEEVALPLMEIGVPLAAGSDGAVAVVLAGGAARGFSREELEQVLSGGVILDGDALCVVHELGLGELTGVRPGSGVGGGTMERLTDDPINGRYAGWHRDARPGFFNLPAALVEPLDETARQLSRVVTVDDGKDMGCCGCAYENEAGGRVVSFSYSPWVYVHNAAKRAQMHGVVEWITDGAIPCQVLEPARMVPFVRLNEGSPMVVALANAAFDPVDCLTLSFSRRPAQVEILRGDGTWESADVKTEGERGASIRLGLAVEPWTVAVLRVRF